jgi:hypothetical protein
VCSESASCPTTEAAGKSGTIKTNKYSAIRQLEITNFDLKHLLGGWLPFEIGKNFVENRLTGRRPPLKNNLIPLYPDPPANYGSQGDWSRFVYLPSSKTLGDGVALPHKRKRQKL